MKTNSNAAFVKLKARSGRVLDVSFILAIIFLISIFSTYSADFNDNDYVGIERIIKKPIKYISIKIRPRENLIKPDLPETKYTILNPANEAICKITKAAKAE